MSRPVLNAAVRNQTGKGPSRRLRAEGKIPGVVYGKGMEPVMLTLEPKPVATILQTGRGTNTPIDLRVEGEGSPRLTLIKDFQVHPWKRTLKHVDFWQVAPDAVITLNVPLRKEGRCALERIGGSLRIVRKSILISCTPDKIPPEIVVDVTDIPEEQRTVMVSEVSLPGGVEAQYRNDYPVFQIASARVELEEEGEEEEGLLGEAGAPEPEE